MIEYVTPLFGKKNILSIYVNDKIQILISIESGLYLYIYVYPGYNNNYINIIAVGMLCSNTTLYVAYKCHFIT